MDTSTIIIFLLVGIIQLILIFAVIRTSENTKEMITILNRISKDLSNITKPANVPINANSNVPSDKNLIQTKPETQQVKTRTTNPVGRTECPQCHSVAYSKEAGKCLSCGFRDLTYNKSESTIDFDGLSKAMKE